ncbi:bifunctional DNA-binding transcriptional regulator/O6-methylguanine-DNA methyltransferase Ada [Hyphomicrobium methylovorum]|uniref:bifunctional DNA-binding transcriptional regulator/O6-methylguanine-DNA methyltransferase Ada n=1 Tax=Hyphomicrobium methylovorum TaxID=84 RepID=UPI0015E6672B|nr:bifunctional DNA-binding transcriptional regulator/O6-methylguanine-DNA methyltransferase Ada [Hyphomicrobium methylovorum]MBA2125444.1 bifunctional DNA-binding transcriptional regulator/O6-methylguanine-DNA methyltransferase Ada [Hyphomicrobium methylovorum]
MALAVPKSKTLKSSSMTDETCWNAVKTRDASFDGQFVYSVATTGVFCRPACPSRLAKRENVRFYASAADAEAAGFRPCKRCRPTEPPLHKHYAEMIAAACRTIETADDQPSLETLAANAGLSSFHFHRIFKIVTGVTPKAYAIANRQKRVRDNLKQSSSVTEALYDAGFNSSGRFYADAPDVLGMTPTDFRSGGANTEIRFAVGQCSLGAVLVAASAKGISAITLSDDPRELVHDLERRFPNATLIGGDSEFEAIVAQVVGLVERPGKDFNLPLDIRGTAFQHRVWQALREIPFGMTATYAEIAAQIGMPKAVRAVAGACAANEIALAIPCHRVIRSDGGISGYRWGVERKQVLLEREANATKKKKT